LKLAFIFYFDGRKNVMLACTHFIFNTSKIISCELKKTIGLIIAYTFFHRSVISVSWDW